MGTDLAIRLILEQWGDHLLHSGGSIMERRLLPLGLGWGSLHLYFPLESSTELCSTSHLMGG